MELPVVNELFNSREIAIAIWLAVIVVVAVYFKNIRKSAVDVPKAFFTPKLFIPLLVSFLPAILVIVTLANFKLWDLSVLKETSYWIIGTGLVMFFNSMKVKDVKTLFAKTAKRYFKVDYYFRVHY